MHSDNSALTETHAGGVLEQFGAAVVRQVVEQLRPLFPSGKACVGVQQRLFDVSQAASYLGRSEQAVRLMIHRRKIKVTKLDGKVQIDRAVLDKLIEDCTFYES